MSYKSANAFEYKDALTFRCYICNKLLGANDLSRDHIIPQALFDNEKTLRPTIKVHASCNSSDKSREDRWFSKMLMFRCQENKKAHDKFLDFISSADKSRLKDLDASKKDLANHKLLSTIIDGWYVVAEDITNKKFPATMRPTKDALSREEEYIKMMARGLIIRNSWFARVTIEDIITSQFSALKRLRMFSDFQKTSKELFYDNLDDCIYQFWDNDLKYIINPHQKMLYFEFFNQIAYVVKFEISFPSLYVKDHTPQTESTKAQQFLLDRMGLWAGN